MKVDAQLTPRGGLILGDAGRREGLILGDAGRLTASLTVEGGGREFGAREVTVTVEKDPEQRVSGGL